MGQANGNPMARARAAAPPGAQLVRVFNLDETHGMIPQVQLGLQIDANKKEVQLVIVTRIIRLSPLPEAQKESTVVLLELGAVPWNAIVERFEAGLPTDG